MIITFHPSKQKVTKKLKGEKEKAYPSLLLIYYFVAPIYLIDMLENIQFVLDLELRWAWYYCGGELIFLEGCLFCGFFAYFAESLA